MAKVILEGLYKTYDGINNIVKGINLTIPHGEFLVLVGASGCGKTTTLRMIAGLEEISSGNIYIDDQKVNDMHPKDRNIAMVFQNYALYPHMTVRQNMEFGLKLRKHSKTEIDERIAEASETLELSKLLDRKPRQLSGGQRQRVALGRAIVRRPKAFLMDEPLSNLDAKLRVQTRGEIKKLHSKLGTTIIYVTHDQVEAMTLGDRIAVMHEGLIQQCESPVTVYDMPANKFVAGFIGSPAMNFFEGQVVLKNNQHIFLTEGFELVLPSALKEELSKAVNIKTVLGIRPTDLYDQTAADFLKVDLPAITAKVDFSELLGSENYIHSKIGKQAVVVKADPHIVGKIGSSFKVFFNLKRLHLFDHATQKRII